MDLDDEENQATREANGANRRKGNMEEDIKICETFKTRQKTINYNKITLKDVQAIENILAELEKKDRQIIKLKNNNQNLLRKLRNRIKEIKKLTRYALYKKEITTLNKQLQQKNKIIEEMAEFIDEYITDCLLNKLNIDKACQEHRLCKDCIKQYFKKKVEEKNERNKI